jgi:transposase
VIHRILFVLSEGCSWRAIDSEDARWNSIYQYWNRWCREGVWQEILSRWMPELAGNLRFIDSTHVKVHQDGSNPAGGQQGQDMGKTKGGLNTKIHAGVDKKGNPEVLILGPGQEADISVAEEIVSSMDMEKLAADKGYDSDAFRAWLYERGVTPCIPPKSNRLYPQRYSKRTYRKRHVVENFFERIKRFRRVATRYDKLSRNFLGFVLLAVIVSYPK